MATMKKIGFMSSEENHEAFSQILRGKGVDFELDPAEGGVEFWAIEEEEHETAQELFRSFRENPSSTIWEEDLAKGKKVQGDEKRDALGKKVRTNVFKLRHSGDRTLVSYALIYSSVAIFLVSHLNPTLWLELRYWLHFALDGNFSGLAEGEIWRLFTPILIHSKMPLHILFNAYWIYTLGRQLELRIGSLFYLRFVLVAAGLSNLLQYLFAGPNFGGLSGVVYALLGYIWLRGKRDPRFGMYIPPQTMMFMMFWLVLCFVTMGHMIANWAHLGGLGAGAGMAYLGLKKRGLL